MRQKMQVVAATILLSLLLLAGQSDAGTRVYVRIAPPKVRTVKVVKSPRPHRYSVWVAGHHKYVHGRHVWVSGYWLGHKPGYVYVQPHWNKSRRGYYFVPGHWVKK